MFLRIQVLRIEATHLRARTALASAVGSEKAHRLALADRLARKLARENQQWASPLTALIKAGIQMSRGDKANATTLLNQAIEGFDMTQMGLYATASRRRLGELVGGERGEKLINESSDWMRAQGIEDFDQMTQMVAPGFANN